MKAEWMVSRVLAVFVVGTIVGVGACKKNAPTTTEKAIPAAAPAVAPPTPIPPAATPERRFVVPDIMAQDIPTMNEKGYLSDAFFDYDRSDLREDARKALAADADWLRKYSRVQFLVEGHCDERGTEAYNLALGDRRANAVKEYVISLGIDAARIKTVSYGRERPFCTGSNEDCWQRNRRGHFLITAK